MSLIFTTPMVDHVVDLTAYAREQGVLMREKASVFMFSCAVNYFANVVAIPNQNECMNIWGCPEWFAHMISITVLPVN